ncbi:hypothetical protein [Deinococcus multiflagellatus]
MSPHVMAQLQGPVDTAGERERRYVAVIFDRDPALPVSSPGHVPTMFASSVYIDMSTDELMDENFERLQRFLLDKPALVAPPLGQVPAHLRGDAPPALPSRAQAGALRRAVEREKGVAGAFQDYVDQVLSALGQLPPATEEREFSMGRAIEAADQFTPVRDEWVEMLRLVIRQDMLPVDVLGDALERMLNLPRERADQTQLPESAFAYLDVLRLELILYTAALLIEARAVEALQALTERTYFAVYPSSQQPVTLGRLGRVSDEALLRQRYNALTERSWTSPVGVWLQTRASLQAVPWEKLLEADLMLALKTALERQSTTAQASQWHPVTGPGWQRRGPVPLFERFTSRRVLGPWLPFFRAASADELRTQLHAAFPDRSYSQLMQDKWREWSVLSDHLSLDRLGSLN